MNQLKSTVLSSPSGAIHLAILALVQASAVGQQHHIPQQPIPFSHKQHVALSLKCQNCHTNPTPGLAEDIPPASKCMACHVAIATDKPWIQQLKGFADRGQPVPWIRVYQIPAYVKFSHRRHTQAGFSCERCHGPVETREALWKETNISMDGCVACHRQHKAGIACNTCHAKRE